VVAKRRQTLTREPGEADVADGALAEPPAFSDCRTEGEMAIYNEQDLGIWNHLGVVVNWLLGACKMHLGKLLGACKLDLGKAPVEAPGSL
jgi:hypothetical protein